MSHFAVIAPPLFSHLRALEALSQTLINRGHKITFIQQAEALDLLREPAIERQPIGAKTHPKGSLEHTLKLASKPGGLSILGLIEDMARTTDMLCDELPTVLNHLAVDGLIVDQMEPAGGLVAEALGIPFVSVACALPVNREPGLPLPVMPFEYADDERAHKLYHSSQQVYDWMMRRHDRVIARHAQDFGLSPRHGLQGCLSPLAQISQTIASLDFPRHQMPPGFHCVGPLRKPVTHESTPWPIDPTKSFIFASLGTLQGHRYKIFKTIARACHSLGVQLLIAHCGGLDKTQEDKLLGHGATWVTDFADQNAVLQQAQAVITHGGLNTVADAITHATPILAIPIAFDQPGVAARVVWSGIGRKVSRYCTADTLEQSLDFLLHEPSYKQRLIGMQEELRQAGGVERAATIVEQALSPQKLSLSRAAS